MRLAITNHEHANLQKFINFWSRNPIYEHFGQGIYLSDYVLVR